MNKRDDIENARFLFDLERKNLLTEVTKKFESMKHNAQSVKKLILARLEFIKNRLSLLNTCKKKNDIDKLKGSTRTVENVAGV